MTPDTPEDTCTKNSKKLKKSRQEVGDMEALAS